MKIRSLFVIMIMCFSILAASQELQTVARFHTKDFLPRLGNITLKRLFSDKHRPISQMEKIAQKNLFKQITRHLQSLQLDGGLQEMEIVNGELVSIATPRVNQAIKGYLQVIATTHSFILQIQAAIDVPIAHLKEWSKTSWSIQNIGISDNEAKKQLAQFRSMGIEVRSTPKISIADNYINLLKMSQKEKLNYITGYKYIKTPHKKLAIPQLKKLIHAFHLSLLPMISKNKNILHMYAEAADYKKPIKQISTPDGVIHRPQTYYQAQKVIISFSPPSTLRFVIGPTQEKKAYVLYLKIQKEDNNSKVLSGQVMAKIQRKIIVAKNTKAKYKLPQIQPQYILATGKSGRIQLGQKVNIFHRDTQKIMATGQIVSIHDQVCIAECKKEINEKMSQMMYTIYEK